MEDKKLGLPSVISTGAGLIVATSCMMTVGQGSGTIGITFIISMVIACAINICTVLSLSELNALMPNLTGGLAQYTLACMGPFASIICMVGGYLLANTICGSVECAMFGNAMNSVFHTPIPSSVFCIILILVLMVVNLNGVDMFSKIQNTVVVFLLSSVAIMGGIGLAKLGTGETVSQPYVISQNPAEIMSFAGLAFFLFMGCEFAIPISNQVRNAKRNVPLGMVLSLVLVCVIESVIVMGMHNYVLWDELAADTSPHILYGMSVLGNAGKIWMTLISVFAAVSTMNSIISSLSYICAGMAKINLLPRVFMKKNRKGAPYVGIFTISGIMMFINATGLSTADEISFFILIICVFWMIAYVVSNINVLILRRRQPKTPRNFKLPFGALIPVLGIIGNIFMIANIDSEPAIRIRIYQICLIIFAVMSVYAILWIKLKMKRKLFRAIPINEVMAMENELYHVVRRKIEK